MSAIEANTAVPGEETLRAVVRVGGGRGFVVEASGDFGGGDFERRGPRFKWKSAFFVCYCSYKLNPDG